MVKIFFCCTQRKENAIRKKLQPSKKLLHYVSIYWDFIFPFKFSPHVTEFTVTHEGRVYVISNVHMDAKKKEKKSSEQRKFHIISAF
jgi:hypothetical protein